MTIAENIRRIRKEKHMTQKQLGSLCGMDEANIRKYELGKINPKIETAERIAEALGVNVIELIDLEVDGIRLQKDTVDMKTDRFMMQQDKLRQGKYIEDKIEIELLENFQKLNSTGKLEARKRVEELTEIPRYTRR